MKYNHRKILNLSLMALVLLSFWFSYAYSQCYDFPTVEEGKLIKNCQPYRAIGVNYFDAFLRTIKNPEDKSYKEGFRILREYNIPFARVTIGGYWPSDWKLYLTNKEKYFELLDEFIKTAEEYKIGLVIDFFWNVSTVPDIVGEPVSALGDRDSKTIEFIKTFTREVVSRYKDSPAVWVWEFGNEYSNVIDLPGKIYPKVAPQYGTPEFRTEKDKLRWRDVISAFIIFADTVREIDKLRPLSTGNTIPRPFAYHLAFYGKWERDTSQQFLYMLKLLNPDSYELISVHLYPPAVGQYFSDIKLQSFGELVSFLMDASRKFNKVLFVGEFGVCRTPEHAKTVEEEKQKFKEMVDVIYSSQVPLSAIWVFDRRLAKDPCNVYVDNDRVYQLELISDMNRKILERKLYKEGYIKKNKKNKIRKKRTIL